MRWRRRSGEDFAAEIRAHLELEADTLAREGVPARLALAAARRSFGNVTATREQFFESRRTLWLEALYQDLRYAIRQLRRSPVFTATALSILAIGIALNTTVFSVVSAVLLHPVPFHDPDRLVVIFRTDGGDTNREWVAAADLETYRAQNRSFAELAAYYQGPFTLRTNEDAEYLHGAIVTPNSFHVLGVQPLLGRDFVAGDGAPGRDQVAILSWGLWMERFAGRRDAIGSVISLNGKSRTIIGVMPRGFQFPELERIWVPDDLSAIESGRDRFFVAPFARLAAGVSLERASAEVAAIAARINAADPGEHDRRGARVALFREQLINSDYLRTPFLLLLGAVGFVLLIACANIAHLQLARAAARQHEIALRAALGAGSGRLARQLVTESMLLAVIGGTIGVVLSTLALRILQTTIPIDLPDWLHLTIDPAVLLFAVTISIATGITFGLAPALAAARAQPNVALKDGGRVVNGSMLRTRARGTLVVFELSTSLVLLVAAMLMVKSFLRLQQSPLGFEPGEVVTAQVSLAGTHYDSAANRAAFYDRVLQGLAVQPTVRRATATSDLPLNGGSFDKIEIEARPVAVVDAPTAMFSVVVGDYFRALQIPLLAGRSFTEQEWKDTVTTAVVVNESMARRFWPTESAVGRRVRPARVKPGPWFTIVGVVGDIAQEGLGVPVSPEVFLTGRPLYGMTFVVRGTGDPSATESALRRSVAGVDQGVPVHDVATFNAAIARSSSVWLPHFYGVMFGVFAIAALVLATIGVYGVVAFSVRQRAQEIGIRMALGAAPRAIVAMLLRQGAVLVLIGITLGLAGALAAARLLRGLLYGVGPDDPDTMVLVPTALASVALLASYLPARRAARVDPAVTLRDD